MPKREEQPDWKATLRAEIDALPSVGGAMRSEGSVTCSTDFLPGAWGAIVHAARGRKITTNSYVRRAALALAAYDLGIPVTDLFERDPRVAKFSGVPINDPSGLRFGVWGIVDVQAVTE